jgi:ribA/ribD-fused uncharacterized protein
MSEINNFRGPYRWLSNFEYAPFIYQGIEWPTSEHAYQAMKSRDQSDWERVARLPTPKDAKAAGYKLKIRHDWEQIKYQVMYHIVRAKFFQNPNLAEKLLATGFDKLVEGNTWGDTYWGVCNGRGENNLGKILMKVREDLRWQE